MQWRLCLVLCGAFGGGWLDGVETRCGRLLANAATPPDVSPSVRLGCLMGGGTFDGMWIFDLVIGLPWV